MSYKDNHINKETLNYELLSMNICLNDNESKIISNIKEKRILKKEYNVKIQNKQFQNMIHNIKPIKSILILFKLIIIIQLFIQVLSNNTCLLIKSKFSQITLKIYGYGNKKVFNSTFNNYPDEMFINGVKAEKVNNSYYLIQSNNTIELIWNDDIYDCQYMFSGCSDINEIDLSHFYSSKANRTNYMFANCSSLTSINLVHFDTSNVKYMNRMFSGCSNLTS